MEKFIVTGGNKINGSIDISGSKRVTITPCSSFNTLLSSNLAALNKKRSQFFVKLTAVFCIFN